MSNKRDEVWYCVNSKGHKIAPYGDSSTNEDKKRERDSLKLFIYISLVFVILLAGCILKF